MNKKFALMLLATAFGLAAYVVLDNWRFEKLPLTKKMQKLWEDDMELMADSHILPRGWSSIREIEISPGSDEARAWLKHLQVPVVLDKKGDFKLLIIFMPWNQDGKDGVYIQYDLEDLTSPNKNTVFETSRTIMLKDPAEKPVWDFSRWF
jgi:hypothetical protein